ncbi:MAG: 2Fe-2S iron-sulfur cluster binding domain-containing protein [Gammaproteobacteria bacterium]|nr:2Fe-2S iron-sulfur cluster binding domain-containing protein [Gammaproteobacteria bacterium]
MNTIKIAPGDTSFECHDDDTILRAALRSGIGMPYSCNVGSCGNCRFELINGKVEHLHSDPPAWSERDLKRNRWLGCQAKPDGACEIKFRAEEKYINTVRPEKRRARLEGLTQITHDITEFNFSVTGEDNFLAGQYALLQLPGVEGQRAYSMSNLPGTGEWRFMVKRLPGGAATTHLFDTMAVGDSVEIDGPYGTAFLQTDSQKDIVLIAGGSGLSPMISILTGIFKAGPSDRRKVDFFYGCRSPEDIFDIELLNKITGPSDRVRFVAACSDASLNSNDRVSWSGPTGYIHDVVNNSLSDQLLKRDIYFAGPAVMSAALQKMAYDMKIPIENMYFDEFF